MTIFDHWKKSCQAQAFTIAYVRKSTVALFMVKVGHRIFVFPHVFCKIIICELHCFNC